MLADPTSGLDWLATRAYDPTTGRFLARDPLGRAPLFFADNPYVYAGNNPVSNVDPTGQYRAAGHGSAVRESGAATNRMMARVVAKSGCGSACKKQVHTEWVAYQAKLAQQKAKGIAGQAAAYFDQMATLLPGNILHFPLAPLVGVPVVGYLLKWIEVNLLATSFPWATTMFFTLAGGLVAQDIVAGIIAQVFQQEAQQAVTTGADWWSNPRFLASDYLKIQILVGVSAALVGGVMCALIALVPNLTPLWVVAGSLSMARIFSLMPLAEVYIDREERALGYAQS